MSEQPFSFDFTVGSLDTDGGGHVSNVTFPKYLEIARMRYLHETLGDHLAEQNFVLVNLDLDYLAELFPGDEVTVEVRTADVGSTSFELEYKVRTPETVTAEATTVQVVRDHDTGESVPVPDIWRECLLPEATP